MSLSTNTDTKKAAVHKRLVFYIPGYDPFHPRRYRELYRKEGRAQADISGYDLQLTARKDEGRFGWDVQSHIDETTTETTIEVLVWSDIVRDSMASSIPSTYLLMLQTAWRYIASGTLFRLMRLRKGPVIAALYPVVFLVAQMLIALGLGFALAWLGRAVGGIGWGAYLVVVPVTYTVLRWFKEHDGKVFAYYLMQDYAHSAQYNGAYGPDLEARLANFKTRVAKALTADVDEVLVVGHSSGAYLGVTVLADLIRSGAVAKSGPQLGYLSLGQVVPMVAFLPNADRLRGDLQYLSQRDELIWVDVTAPGDGCAFALCDPVAVTGVATPQQKWPIVFSAAFTKSLSPARWQALKRRYFRLHFQYLCAFDAPLDYDYFQITAGPLTLRTRYSGRVASTSRITEAINTYTSVR